MTTRLTEAQWDCLREICREGCMFAFNSYPPTNGLVDLGLAIRRDAGLSHPRFTPTAAGRAALLAHEGEKK